MDVKIIEEIHFINQFQHPTQYEIPLWAAHWVFRGSDCRVGMSRLEDTQK